MAKRQRPPSRRDKAIGDQRTSAIDKALSDAPAPRRRALLRGVDRQPVVIRAPKPKPDPQLQLPMGDQ